jgi:hypothetical protein
MAGRGVRILANDQHPHVGERLLEGAQHPVARGQVPLALSDLLAQEHAHVGDLVLNWGERVRPARLNDVAQRLSHAQKIAQAADKGAPGGDRRKDWGYNACARQGAAGRPKLTLATSPGSGSGRLGCP